MFRAPRFGCLDQSGERLERKRLRDVADDARLDDGARVDVYKTRGQHDWHSGKLDGDLLHEPHTVVAGHAHIAEHEGDVVALEEADGREGVGRVRHLVSHDFDTAPEKLANAAIVVYDENEGRGAHDVGNLSCHDGRSAAIGRRYLRAPAGHRECKFGRLREETLEIKRMRSSSAACYNSAL
jgi:hypothetical protein